MATIKIKTSPPNVRLTKRDFGLKNKAHDWEEAPWSWILKRGYLSSETDPEGHRHITLNEIVVSIWPEHHKPYDPNLDMRFNPTLEGTTEARNYTRAALKSGAVMAEIRMTVNFPWKPRALAQMELYSLDEPSPVDPRDL